VYKTISKHPTLSLFCLLILFFQSCSPPVAEAPAPPTVLAPERAAELAKEIREEVSVRLADNLNLSLWASDSLSPDPVALFMDEQGRAYITRTNRIEHSEFDIRGYRNWMTESISWQNVEDRRNFLRDTMDAAHSDVNDFMEDLNQDSIRDWHDLTVEKEQVFRIEDKSGDGVADYAQLILEDFNTEITDLAMAFLKHEDDYFIGVAPDLWRLKDHNKDGIIDSKESISHGYQVHIGFGAHGMSGLTVGPDGKIYWGIGDIGMNVVDKSGKRWSYPNRGVIVRANPDGSDFEVYAHGVRNTHEFVFDKYGNLISVDNDGDHPGEQERLVYLINGSDSGWRINWQFGKYTDPDNNTYKVWMDEKMYKPRWDGQAAYFLPPVANYHSGPTGMLYNPGTALSEHWYDKFFIVEFTGSPARSSVYAFELKPKGAGFEFVGEEEVMNGILATGLQFGPEGALYAADWIEGWGAKDRGRIWKIDDDRGMGAAIRKETQQLIQQDFTSKTADDLLPLLHHQDMRIRQKAQFALAKRGNKSLSTFQAAITQKEQQLGRIHGIWGIGQLAQKDVSQAQHLVALLQDDDEEIRAQAAKIIGDVRYADAAENLLPLLKDYMPRVRLMATEALGRMAYKGAVQGILDMAEDNNDEDTYLRHAAAIALARIGESEPLVALHDHPSEALKTVAIVALRRMQAPGIREFLNDENEYILAEVARAINDDYSIEEALPDLARLLNKEGLTNEPLIRRIINANLRVGESENIALLANFAMQEDAPVAMRAEAIATLGVWQKPSVLDRVDGRMRGLNKRDPAEVQRIIKPILANLLIAENDAIKMAGAEAAGKLQIKESANTLFDLVNNNKVAAVRVAALKALFNLNDPKINEAVEIALNETQKEVRLSALELIPELDISEEKAVDLFATLLQTGSIAEQQTALEALAKYDANTVRPLFLDLLTNLKKGNVEPAIQLELIEAIEATEDEQLLAELESYNNSRYTQNILDQFRECLEGGAYWPGRNIFASNQAAQCTRCHALGDWGGDVGPDLTNIANVLSREELLESLVNPGARIAPGYGAVTISLKDGTELSGIIAEETASNLILKLNEEDRIISKSDIEKRQNAPSAMPPMNGVLSKRELRDLVEFLSSLKNQEPTVSTH
jgi:putative heme-binding domain-containing protein